LHAVSHFDSQQAGGDRADAGHTQQTTAQIIVSQLASHLFIQQRDLLIQIAEVCVQPLQQCAEPYRQLMLGQNARQTFYDRPPQRQADAELQQEAMELIDCFGAVTHQRLTHAMQY
jgi:hypothetical protein